MVRVTKRTAVHASRVRSLDNFRCFWLTLVAVKAINTFLAVGYTSCKIVVANIHYQNRRVKLKEKGILWSVNMWRHKMQRELGKFPATFSLLLQAVKIGHLPLFQNDSVCKTAVMKMKLNVQINLSLIVYHKDSFWNRGHWQLPLTSITHALSQYQNLYSKAILTKSQNGNDSLKKTCYVEENFETDATTTNNNNFFACQ